MKSLYEHFMPVGAEIDVSTQTQKLTKDNNSVLKPKYHAQISLDYPVAQRPKGVRNSEKTNKGGLRKWIPKDKITYVADILSRLVETPVMVPEQWMLMTYDRHKVYVPRFGT